MTHKAGFVNIVGNPNVGKSTLMNTMLGENLSIITHKSQTTRHRIKGIYNKKNLQIIFSDTPGIIKPKYKLQKYMLEASISSLVDADILIFVTDTVELINKNTFFIEKLKFINEKLLLVINKIDLLHNQEELEKLVDKWKIILPKAEIFPISAKNKFNTKNLLNRIIEFLPDSPPYFPKDTVSDLPVRFFVSEIIREKVFLNYKQEIPYATNVSIESYKDEEKIIKIRSNIFVEKESQKGILIGKEGNALKRTGQDARKDIEAFIGKKVYLELHVKVRKKWRDRKYFLKEFGYLG